MILVSTFGFGLTVLVVCCLAGPIGDRLGLIDRPDGIRKWHAVPTPVVGGIALMVPLTLAAFAEAARHDAATGVFAALGLTGLGFTVLGWIDDRDHLAPEVRLAVATLLALVAVGLQPQLRLDALRFGGLALPLGYLALPFTLLCLIGLQNATNMTDGLNGLLIALCLFWTVCLLIYAPPHLIYFLNLLFLGLCVLLPFNLMGRLFLGDAGSYSLGIVVGLMMIYVYHESPDRLPMATVVLWLAIPVLDCLRVMAERLLVGRSPFAADRNHLHHLLLRRFSDRGALLAYLGIAAGPGMVAAIWPSTTGAMAVMAILGWLGSLLWLRTSDLDRSKAGRRGALAAVTGIGRWASSTRPRLREGRARWIVRAPRRTMDAR